MPANDIQLPNCKSWNLHATIEKIGSSMQLLGHIHMQLCSKRKRALAPFLNFTARGLTGKTQYQSDKLLGNDVTEELERLKRKWRQTSTLM